MSAAGKPSSYPSRQLRGGPAPLASFEDLSDEIDSPEEPNRFGIDDTLDDLVDDPDTDDGRTYSEGATPSTPRVLAQTPSTPLGLDYDFSTAAATPDSPDLAERTSLHFAGTDPDSRSDTPLTLKGEPTAPPSESSTSVQSSPRASPLFGRRMKGATLDTLQVTSYASSVSSTENLGGRDSSCGVAAISTESVSGPTKSGLRSGGPGTPSPRSARKLFTMSFFKPRDDRTERTPSPMLSPRSPRRLSPAASPKSPRKSLAFANLFKSGSSKEDVGAGSDQQMQQQSSPSKKRSHFPHFLRSSKGEDKKVATPEAATPPGEPSRKEGRHAGRVFSTLFRRDHGTTTVGKQIPLRSSQTPEDEEWIPPSKVQATAPKSAPPFKPPLEPEPISRVSQDDSLFSRTPMPISAHHDIVLLPATTTASNLNHTGLVAVNGDHGQFESTHDIGGTFPDVCDPTLRLGFSPSMETPHSRSSSGADPESISEPPIDQPPVPAPLEMASPSEDDQSLVLPASLATDRKISPESEAEIPELDPTVLKALKGEEPEAETLLREDSFENDDGPDVAAALLLAARRTSGDKEVAKHKDKVAAFRANPVDRPRCTAPVSIASLEAYIAVAQPCAASEEVTSPDRVKLKVILPGEEFGHKSRQPKKPVYKSWFEFCEVGLQSPRSRRRQLGGSSRSPSSMPASRETTIEEDDRRAESLDFGFSPAAWTTFEQQSADFRLSIAPSQNGTNGMDPVSHQHHLPSCLASFHASSSDSTPEDPNFPSHIPPEECRCECHVSDVPSGGEPAPVSDSSPSSDGHSPKEVAGGADEVADSMFLRDEEVEPLVCEGDDGHQPSDEFLVGEDAGLYTTAAVPDSFSSFSSFATPARRGEHNAADYAIVSVVDPDVRPPCVGRVNFGYGDEDDSDWSNGIGGGATPSSVGALPACVTSMIHSDRSARSRDLSSCSQHLDYLSSEEEEGDGGQSVSLPAPDAFHQSPAHLHQSRGPHWSSCGVDLLATLPSSPKPDTGCPPLVAAAQRGRRGPPPPPPPRSSLTALHSPRTTAESSESSAPVLPQLAGDHHGGRV